MNHLTKWGLWRFPSFSPGLPGEVGGSLEFRKELSKGSLPLCFISVRKGDRHYLIGRVTN